MDYYDTLQTLLTTANDTIAFLSTHDENADEPMFGFSNPHHIISTSRCDEIHDALAELDRWINEGWWCAGFIAYEAGFAFEDRLTTAGEYPFPLVWFGVFKKPSFMLPYDPKQLLQAAEKFCESTPYSINNVRQIDREAYIHDVNIIQNYISKGDIYQANYTFKQHFDLHGPPAGLFCDLLVRQQVGYAAYATIPGHAIISLSPELFFRRNDSRMTVKPMKGTIHRGVNNCHDDILKDTIRHCIKNRSENLMIVDLLRNDLGKVSTFGSVKTDSLFDVIRYDTLFQMTSTITSKLPHNTPYSKIFRELFPSGSVTGAPKIRAMEIIKELESEPRGIYTGAMGYIAPDGKAQFNVAIRTVHVNRHTGAATLGIGSGIVADSDPESEFAECRLKSDFLHKPHPTFELIETMLWRDGEIFLSDYHMKRLCRSADYFGFYYDESAVESCLKTVCNNLERDKTYRIRLTVDKYNNINTSFNIIKVIAEHDKCFITLSCKKVCSNDKYLCHKTTNRTLYDTEYQFYRQKGFFDVIFMNEKGHITEGAITNIFIKRDGRYLTPPVESGLLQGTYRDYFLETHASDASEQIITPDDLTGADEIFVCNSVRGMVPVRFVAPSYFTTNSLEKV